MTQPLNTHTNIPKNTSPKTKQTPVTINNSLNLHMEQQIKTKTTKLNKL